jgi:hypothetical protein
MQVNSTGKLGRVFVGVSELPAHLIQRGFADGQEAAMRLLRRLREDRREV